MRDRPGRRTRRGGGRRPARALGLGKARLRQGRVEEAAACFRQAVVLRPHLSEPYFQLGLAALLTGCPAEAVPFLERAAALAPVATLFVSHLALALQQTGEKERARRLYQELRRIDAPWFEAAGQGAWHLATNADRHRRDGRRAALLAQIVCQAATPPTARQLDILAAAYAEAGRFNEAVATMRRALAVQGAGTAELLTCLRLYETREAFHQNRHAADIP